MHFQRVFRTLRHALIAACAVMITSCTIVGRGLPIEVVNELDFDRICEVAEIDWELLKGHFLSPDKVVVIDSEGKQKPSQVVFDADGRPEKLLLLASVDANASTQYFIKRAKPASYVQLVYGRYVPERMDDYAWENTLTCYRIYGPKLSDPRTQGVDVWVKRSNELVINEWYARGDYHHNYGKGMDCYKVGNTLGGGALAVIDEGKLLLAGNYTQQRCTANGPLRTSAEFEYTPTEVNGKKISFKRIITLDANSRFSLQEYHFDGFDGEIEVAAGIVMHDVKDLSNDSNYVAITEPASDSKQPHEDGDISLAVILDGAVTSAQIDSHAVVTRKIKAGDVIRMWNGSAWSQAGISSHEQWVDEVERFNSKIKFPLKAVPIKR